MAKTDLLYKMLPFFDRISNAHSKELLMNYWHEFKVKENTYLTHEGKCGDYIYILQEGEVSVYKNYKNPKNIYYDDCTTIFICTLDW